METAFFSNLMYGDVFVFTDDEQDSVWCKAPSANAHGFGDTAVCIKGKHKGACVQCSLDARCTIIDTESLAGNLLGAAEHVSIPVGPGSIGISACSDKYCTTVAVTYDAPNNGGPGATMVYEKESGDVSLAIFPKDSPDTAMAVFAMNYKPGGNVTENGGIV